MSLHTQLKKRDTTRLKTLIKSMRNSDPFAPWNSGPEKYNPFAPWNNVETKDDPLAPWNNEEGKDWSGGRYNNLKTW